LVNMTMLQCISCCLAFAEVPELLKQQNCYPASLLPELLNQWDYYDSSKLPVDSDFRNDFGLRAQATMPHPNYHA